MRKYYEALAAQFKTLHDEAVKALEVMPAEALDWVPGPEMNSLAVLVMHFTGSERYWVGDVVRGDPSFRDRDAEFRTQGMGADTLKKRITDLDTYESKVFETLKVRDLDVHKISPRDGRNVTVAWALLHALKHTAGHLGHIEILVQQWKQRV